MVECISVKTHDLGILFPMIKERVDELAPKAKAAVTEEALREAFFFDDAYLQLSVSDAPNISKVFSVFEWRDAGSGLVLASDFRPLVIENSIMILKTIFGFITFLRFESSYFYEKITGYLNRIDVAWRNMGTSVDTDDLVVSGVNYFSVCHQFVNFETVVDDCFLGDDRPLAIGGDVQDMCDMCILEEDVAEQYRLLKRMPYKSLCIYDDYPPSSVHDLMRFQDLSFLTAYISRSADVEQLADIWNEIIKQDDWTYAMIDGYSLATTFLMPDVRLGSEGSRVVFYGKNDAEKVARRVFGAVPINAVA